MKATDLPRVPGIPRTPLWSGRRMSIEAGAFKDEPSVIVGYLYDLDGTHRLDVCVFGEEVVEAKLRRFQQSDASWFIGRVIDADEFVRKHGDDWSPYPIPLIAKVFSAINAVVPS